MRKKEIGKWIFVAIMFFDIVLIVITVIITIQTNIKYLEYLKGF